MIINSVLLDKKRYKLVDNEYCSEANAFTVIVGSNGTGKSRILKRITNNVKNIDNRDLRIPSNYSRQLDVDIDGFKTSFYSPISESRSFISNDKINVDTVVDGIKVIAVTTTPFDKFPVEYKGREVYRYNDEDRYTYIGLKVSKNSLNQSNYINLLARSMLKNDNILNNKKLFSLLKLAPNVEVLFKTKLPPYEPIVRLYNGKKRTYTSTEFNFEYFTRLISHHYKLISEKLHGSKEHLYNAYKAYVECSPYLSCMLSPTNNIPRSSLLYLLDIGIINASDIVFFNENEFEPIAISDLSSGQKCMILTLLNIAGSISDNSIVCIDEPEISLHPKWQKEFMKTLIEFFSEYKKCHFIIATHSPLIISQLSMKNCFILNMDIGFAKKARDYQNMSSDYQLVEIFGVTGNNNEYLNRVVVSLLSKLSSKGELNKQERTTLDHLTKLKLSMNDNDSVKELISILELAWDEVTKNANK
ncbi:AAA family ATPase [Aeromonas sp. SCS5]|nr:AAA family ATPase [Aeromonas sp. SCS5]